MKTILDYQGMTVNFLENQTIGNCIDLGFSTEKTKSIIETMRKDNVDYLKRNQLEKYRNN